MYLVRFTGGEFYTTPIDDHEFKITSHTPIPGRWGANRINTNKQCYHAERVPRIEKVWKFIKRSGGTAAIAATANKAFELIAQVK